MKRVLIKIIFVFVPIIFLVIGINFFIDPANLFNDMDEKIARELLNGHKVINHSNFNDRVFQKTFIGSLSKNPDIVILGSSQIMLLGKESLGDNLVVFNNGVSSANLNDLLAIYYLYFAKGIKPGKVILGLEPWFMNKNNGLKKWTVLSSEFNKMKSLIDTGDEDKQVVFLPAIPESSLELFSFEYFQQSLKCLISGETQALGKPRFTIANSDVNDDMTILTDLSIRYGRDYRSSLKLVEIEAENFIKSKNKYSLNNFHEISLVEKDLLIKFLDFFENNGIEVEFFLAPYHPIVYKYFSRNDDYKIVLDTENLYIKLAGERGIKLIGSFDPERYHLDNSFFYDSQHFRPKAIPIILEKNKLNEPEL